MRYLAVLLLGCLSLPASALTQVDIYRSEVVINNEADNGEMQARQQGMKDVIVKATGDRSAVNNDVIKKALGSSASYVSQLSYGDVEGEQSLNMLFNVTQIRTLLTQAQLPFWSPVRSNILVWVVEEQNYERSIVWEHSESEVIKAMRTATTSRGLPITVPVGDFEDVTGVTVSDLWGGFVDPIALASQRYPVDAVLVLRVQGDDVRWTLYDQNPDQIVQSLETPLSGNASGADAVASMIDTVADHYAAKSAVLVSGESSEALTVKVLNVGNAIDFFTLERTLTQLNSVASAEITKIQGEEVTMKIHLLATPEAFAQEAKALQQLNEFADPFIQPVEEEATEETSTELPVDVAPQPKLVEGAEGAIPSTVAPEALIEQSTPQIESSNEKQYDLIYEWS